MSVTEGIGQSLDPQFLRERFAARFGARHPPRIFRAPGRVNVIGEHTDYNDGLVLPVALQLETLVAAAPRPGRIVTAYSEAMAAVATIDLDRREGPRRDWTDYVAGVAGALEDAGFRLSGADLLIASTVPLAAGLSSSAALEVAVGLALAALAGVPVPAATLARICQRGENVFVGAQCGIMDPFIATHARAGCALRLDCRSLAHADVPLPAAARLVIVHTGVKHRIAEGEYNARRLQCEAAATALGVGSLREATADMVAHPPVTIPDTLRRRARHVVAENQRVVDLVAAFAAGDLDAAGAAMLASHDSLRDDFEVSCRELDVLVRRAMAQPGVYGARMTGGGFGGCAVCLVDAREAAAIAAVIAGAYTAATGNTSAYWVVEPSAAAGEVTAA